MDYPGLSRRVSRRSFLRTTALSSVAFTLGPQIIKGQSRPGPRRPNLLVFLPDQQRADTIACYGGNSSLAPNLSKLGSQSFFFEQACVTQPVCTPSRSSFLTGTWPHTNGCTHNNVRLRRNLHCLPELIDDPDYRCAYMGKWHLGDEVFAQHGFAEWISIIDGRSANLTAESRRIVSDYDQFLLAQDLEPDNEHLGIFSRSYGSHLPFDLSKPNFLAGKACEFLERNQRDPFVLFVAFYEPHPPYNGPLNDEHPLDQIALDPTSRHTFGRHMPLRYRLRQEWDQKRYGTAAEKHLRIKQRYLGLVTEVDRSVGVILEKLEKLGLADKTIVVHSSDHGDMMSAHNLFGKEVLFQEAVRVPYLVRMPNQRSAVCLRQSVSQIDFVPTMLDLLGKPPHPQCAGQSRADLLRGGSMAPGTIFVEWNPDRKRKAPHRTKLAKRTEIDRAENESTRAAISADGWKLCLRNQDKNELYNLRSDPGEEHNLYPSGAARDVVARLTDEIRRWQETVGDTVKV